MKIERTDFTRRRGWALIAPLLAMAFFADPAAAQNKPDFAGKPGVAGQGAGDAEKGARGRSDAAKDLARERGEGEKKGLLRQDGQDDEKAGKADQENKKKKAKSDRKKAKSDRKDKKPKKSKAKDSDNVKAKGKS